LNMVIGEWPTWSSKSAGKVGAGRGKLAVETSTSPHRLYSRNLEARRP
jgi:hypothetical protein